MRINYSKVDRASTGFIAVDENGKRYYRGRTGSWIGNASLEWKRHAAVSANEANAGLPGEQRLITLIKKGAV